MLRKSELSPRSGVRVPVKIWRIALFIAGTCIVLLALMVGGFLVYSCYFAGDVCALHFSLRDAFTVAGIAAYFALFIVAMVTFAYFWFKMFRRRVARSISRSRGEEAAPGEGQEDDMRGMVASTLLILIVLVLSHFFNLNN